MNFVSPLLAIAVLMPPLFAIDSPAYKETMKVVFPENASPEVGSRANHVLKPGKSLKIKAQFRSNEGEVTRKYLRVVGFAQYQKNEEYFRAMEYWIDDNLDAKTVKNDKYSLYFRGEEKPVKQHAYYRLPGTLFKEGALDISINALKKNLKLLKGGDFGVELEIFLKKDGRSPEDVYDKPDEVIFVSLATDLDGGENSANGAFETITKSVTLPRNVAAVMIRVGGTSFTGECHLEAPVLRQDNKQVAAIPFCKFSENPDSHNYWVGINMATRCWPRWRVSRGGNGIFEGNVFDRASDIADFYIPLPQGMTSGELDLTLVDESPRTSFPYVVKSVQVVEETARDFEIVATPKYVSAGCSSGILVEINTPETILTIKESSPSLQFEKREWTLKGKGLHAIPFKALSAEVNADCIISDGVREEKIALDQIVQKDQDHVFLSCGDEMYVDKEDYASYNQFFKWYVNQRIGNWFQFRPSYQWSGFRTVNDDLIRHFTGLLNDLDMPYAWQVEGRALAGENINASLKTLKSPQFKGKQAHENDGGYCYWQHFKYKGLFSDVAARTRPFGGIFAKHRPIYTDHGTFIHYDPRGISDMADGAKTLVDNLKYSRGESTRHTGPSSLFRYFYQAGYKWLGAEQMYGPEETILSSLRGASRAYGREDYGSLHAMQWGSGPYTDPKHSLRFYLSLAVAYMHGSSHINTEDALWTDEYANDRFTKAGKDHLAVQHKILDYIQTHSRKGAQHVPFAFVQGRNDGWRSFVRGALWSQEGEKWQFNRALESFDLVKLFYPENNINASGPEGWFTSTPYGAVDLIPVEMPEKGMDRYKVIMFLGWNTYDEADFKRLRNYVSRGGTLVLTAAHLNEELAPDKAPRFPKKDEIIKRLLGDKYRDLKEMTTISLGKGRIIYFPQSVYPIDPAIRGQFEETVKSIARDVVQQETEKGWIAQSPHIGFTVWDSPERRTIYVLNNDWQSETSERKAVLQWKGGSWEFPARQCTMETIHCFDNYAVLPQGNTTDILNLKKNKGTAELTVQTTGKDSLLIFDAGLGTTKTITVDSAGIHHIPLK